MMFPEVPRVEKTFKIYDYSNMDIYTLDSHLNYQTDKFDKLLEDMKRSYKLNHLKRYWSIAMNLYYIFERFEKLDPSWAESQDQKLKMESMLSKMNINLNNDNDEDKESCY